MKIAFEGVSYSGKSTLSKILSEEYGAKRFPCYVSMVNHDKSVPEGYYLKREDNFKATEYFLNLERERINQRLDGYDKVILDRSYFTLIAHLYSIEKLYNIRVYEEGKKMILNFKDKIEPNIVFYMDINQVILEKRYKLSGRIYDEEIFKKSEYNKYFRSFFKDKYKELQLNIDLIFVPADTDIKSLKKSIMQMIDGYTKRK